MPGALREPDRAPQPARHVARGDGHAQPQSLDGDSPVPSASTRASQRGIRRHGEVEALADPVRVEADELARRASTSAPPDEPGRQRSRVLDAAGDPPAARAAERRATRPRRARTSRAAPPPNGRGDAEHRRADGERVAVAPVDRRVAPAVSTETTARSPSASTPVTVPRVERPSANVTVTSPPRRLWALVRTWPSAMTTPDPRASRPMPTMDGPAVVGDGRDGGTELFDGAHADGPSSGVVEG